MKHVKIQHLNYFVAAYEERSITAAADRVHATQSGVSTQIRDLEGILGLTLFERTPTGVEPTKAGEQIYIRANRVLLEMDGLSSDVEDHSEQLYGTIRAGIMPTFAKSLLAPALIRFSERNPYVDVKITEGYSERLTLKVVNGELDFAVVPNGDLPDGVRSTHVETDVEVLVQSAKTARLDEARLNLGTAPPMKLVLPGPGNARRNGIDRYLNNISNTKHTIVELDSMMTTFDMIGQGDYASVLPGCICLPSLDDVNMKLTPIVNPPLTVDYLLIEPSSKASSNVVKAFAEEVCSDIKKSCQNGRRLLLNQDF